jgi:uncharacterized protein
LPTYFSDYQPSFFLRNGHANTILSFLLRKKIHLDFIRETIQTPDADFLHLDCIQHGNKKCAILVHGLEGSAESTYILSLALLLSKNGWDVVALNLRGCSGKPNNLYRAYHSGATDDLGLIVEKLSLKYSELVIIGFSLGGNIVLKYSGENDGVLPLQVKAIVGVSVPCHLSSSSSKLEQFQNKIYSSRFLKSLLSKLNYKQQLYPKQLDVKLFQTIKTIRDFDDLYTAPSNGFQNAEDYYRKCSSVFFIQYIKVPTLIINAQDDPFLSPQCFPFDEANANPYIDLYDPKFGGHVGFWSEKGKSIPKHEEWIFDFLIKNNLN